MSTELTHTWVNKVLGTFSFGRRYVVSGLYESYIEDTGKSPLYAEKTYVSIVPRG